MTTEDRSRTALQWAVGTLALAPTVTGVLAVLRGTDSLPGPRSTVTPTVDGELRYAAVFKATTGPVVWSQLRTVESSQVVTGVLATLVVGGVARVLSWVQRGAPHPTSRVAVGLELGVAPALLAWQRKVARDRVR